MSCAMEWKNWLVSESEIGLSALEQQKTICNVMFQCNDVSALISAP